jgi:hypothetical protein
VVADRGRDRTRQTEEGMRFSPLAVHAVALAVTAAVPLGCGDGNTPLGGPYGGTSLDPSPSNKASARMSSARGCGTDAGDGGQGTALAVPDSDGGQAAPTWTQIYKTYLGDCGGSGCHVEMNTSSGAYAWLEGKGYIHGANSGLVSQSKSCLKWYGGDMPPCGGGGPYAMADMDAWAAAGALNN